ncbi:MAG: hypothetical protein U0838_06845 [Chloroflexota bacterium]
MLRRALCSAATLALVMSATSGFAATLRHSSASLSEGAQLVAPCDPDGVQVVERLRWEGRVVLDHLEVQGVADRCIGLQLRAVLTGEERSIALPPVRISGGYGGRVSVVVPVPQGISPLRLRDVHVIIN